MNKLCQKKTIKPPFLNLPHCGRTSIVVHNFVFLLATLRQLWNLCSKIRLNFDSKLDNLLLHTTAKF